MEQYRKFNFAKIQNSKLKGGFWGKRTENYMEIINSMLDALLCPTNSAKLLNFAIAAGQSDEKFFGVEWSDGDCYKFLEGCLYVYQNTGDEKVLEIINTYVPWIEGAQESDGYLSTQITCTERERWVDYMNHELYNMGHFFTFAVAHKRITRDERMINCAVKLADYLWDVFSGYPKELAHFGFNPSQIMGLCELGQETKSNKYIKLAEVFVNMRGSQPGGTDQNQDKTPLRDETMTVGHAVTSTYLYAGAADVYALTGEDKLITALERLYNDLTQKRIYITGGVCPDFIGHSERGNVTFESHGTEYVLPNKIAYNESCANIGGAMWMMRMLAVTGNTKYGDWAEQILYNAGISGSNLSLTRYFYSNPLAYRKDVPIPYIVDKENELNVQYAHKATRRWHTFTCWCCPPQLFRTMAGIGRWIYGESDSEVYVNMFANCDYDGENAKLSMSTNYPWEESVNVKVKNADNACVKIRIPAWCKNATVNGNSVKSGEYAQINVSTGDEINLKLPMQPVFMQANANVEQDRGMVCVKRGPVIYCAEGCDNNENLDDYYLDTKGDVTEIFDEALLSGVVKLEVPALVRKQKDSLYYELVNEEEKATLNMIPYYTWANREESDMSVWFPKA